MLCDACEKARFPSIAAGGRKSKNGSTPSTADAEKGRQKIVETRVKEAETASSDGAVSKQKDGPTVAAVVDRQPAQKPTIILGSTKYWPTWRITATTRTMTGYVVRYSSRFYHQISMMPKSGLQISSPQRLAIICC